jgi:hypothetical protein
MIGQRADRTGSFDAGGAGGIAERTGRGSAALPEQTGHEQR